MKGILCACLILCLAILDWVMEVLDCLWVSTSLVLPLPLPHYSSTHRLPRTIHSGYYNHKSLKTSLALINSHHIIHTIFFASFLLNPHSSQLPQKPPSLLNYHCLCCVLKKIFFVHFLISIFWLVLYILLKRKPAAPNSLTEMLISSHPSPLTRVFFDKGPPLRLVAIQTDGWYFIWDWIGNEWVSNYA